MDKNLEKYFNEFIENRDKERKLSFQTFGEGNIAVEKTEWMPYDPQTLISLTIVCHYGELFEQLWSKFCMDGYINSIINKQFSEEDLEKDWCKKEKMYYEELSKRLLKAKPKITIKLELEGSNE
jgi:hypothetical protein